MKVNDCAYLTLCLPFYCFEPSLCGRCHVQHRHRYIPLHAHIDVYSVAIYSPVAQLFSTANHSELMLVV